MFCKTTKLKKIVKCNKNIVMFERIIIMFGLCWPTVSWALTSLSNYKCIITVEWTIVTAHFVQYFLSIKQ
jgi:hypothetical protein